MSAGAFVVVPFGVQAFGDVGEGDADSVLVAFQGVDVDGVGEVGLK